MIYYDPKPLRTYAGSIQDTTRDFSLLLVEMDLFEELYSLARCLDRSNRIVGDRQSIISNDKQQYSNKSNVAYGMTALCKERLRPLHEELHALHIQIGGINKKIDSKLIRLRETDTLPQYKSEDQKLPF